MKPILRFSLSLALAALLGGAVTLTADHHGAALNTLTAEEKSAGWKLLFDGISLDGWRLYGKQEKPSKGWVVENGLLLKQKGVPGGNLITEKKFNDFEFSWEWRLEPKGNNGVKYFVTEARPGAPGHEYQMLDDAGHPDGKVGPDRQTASFYEVLPPATDKPLKPPGEWNHSKIVVKGNDVEHWLNGRLVLRYTLGSAEVKAGIADSKFRNSPGFGDKIAGHIMLTDHQDACWFRNLKIREL
ncbi:MAG TPA: DUF1080 domain-containing protein [Verrucomicrobiales bacterium]|nr:DUF1080 domain-containing protein [Verrucomicrobiales bacterium]